MHPPPLRKKPSIVGEALSIEESDEVGEKKKPIILEESVERFTGRLKFFDPNRNYGFLIMDLDGSDIFVHYDDLSQTKVSKNVLKQVKKGFVIRFSFSRMTYIGKYKKSKKAVDLQLISVQEHEDGVFFTEKQYKRKNA